MEKIIIYNPRHGGEINDLFAKNKYKHEVNTIKKYDVVIGEYLLKKYAFLQEVEPKDVPAILKNIASNFVCKYKGCSYVADTESKLTAHIASKHKINEEVAKALDQVEEATPLGETLTSYSPTPEQSAGIPDTSSGEKDGWYGEGLKSDDIKSGLSIRKRPGEGSGQF